LSEGHEGAFAVPALVLTPVTANPASAAAVAGNSYYYHIIYTYTKYKNARYANKTGAVPGRRVRTSAPASGRVRTPGRPPRGTAPSADAAPFIKNMLCAERRQVVSTCSTTFREWRMGDWESPARDDTSTALPSSRILRETGNKSVVPGGTLRESVWVSVAGG
jgi:hypothetical protein